MDSLKERSIGIDLFGRDSSYEPSSDATVRVRANEVRKRLSSYYASPDGSSELRIDLPTGSYVPRFVPYVAETPRITLPHPGQLALTDRPGTLLAVPSIVPPVNALTLVRPALLALVVCTLLLRHQLENRGDYLRFWDRIFAGRSALVLSVSPQDRLSLASSLYPLVWVAGRYGVDATLQGDSLTGTRQEALASVQVSYAAASGSPTDPRLRWILAASPNGAGAVNSSSQGTIVTLKDNKSVDPGSGGQFDALHGGRATSVALLTIFPEDSATLHVQGTDPEAIRSLLEELTVERNFPSGVVERLDTRHTMQLLMFRDTAGDWHREVSWGGV